MSAVRITDLDHKPSASSSWFEEHKKSVALAATFTVTMICAGVWIFALSMPDFSESSLHQYPWPDHVYSIYAPHDIGMLVGELGTLIFGFTTVVIAASKYGKDEENKSGKEKDSVAKVESQTQEGVQRERWKQLTGNAKKIGMVMGYAAVLIALGIFLASTITMDSFSSFQATVDQGGGGVSPDFWDTLRNVVLPKIKTRSIAYIAGSVVTMGIGGGVLLFAGGAATLAEWLGISMSKKKEKAKVIRAAQKLNDNQL